MNMCPSRSNPADEVPDDECTYCHHKYTEYTENWHYDGFCSKACEADDQAKRKWPGVIRPIIELLREIYETDRPDLWRKYVYKFTTCGAWIALNAGPPDKITLGSIVEDADVDCDTHTLEWPLTKDDFFGALKQIEDQAEEIWNEWNLENMNACIVCEKEYEVINGDFHADGFCSSRCEKIQNCGLKKAPWKDNRGNDLYDRDSIRHPSGEIGYICYMPTNTNRNVDQWLVYYDGDPTLSRLSLQVGGLGMATLVKGEDQCEQ